MMTPRLRDVLNTTPDGTAITVSGWIRTRRDSGGLCFVELNDGSTLHNLQIVVETSRLGASDELQAATTGASVEADGTLVASPGKNQAVELRASALRVIGPAPPESYPLQKKRHSFEYLREIGHLRPRTNTFGAVMRVRNALAFAIHSFFQERGFLYVHTPIITGSDSEGAGEMFQVTTLPLDRLPVADGTVDYGKDFFGKRTALTVSGQLEAEVYALALRDVYTFGPTFRAENSNTTRHLAEFWMVEPEMAFCDIHGNMDLAEAFLKSILSAVLTRCADDMEFFNKWIEPEIEATLRGVLESTFARITYTEAVDRLKSAQKRFEFPVEWGRDLQSEHEKYLTEEVYKGPVIVTDYP
ncbi:MAG TPA: asparagine--tRNA ligase, partial [Spirochaetia bacterium]|nr:asparagine--tRNA ligase [Spirochaetia bacterium]